MQLEVSVSPHLSLLWGWGVRGEGVAGPWEAGGHSPVQGTDTGLSRCLPLGSTAAGSVGRGVM